MAQGLRTLSALPSKTDIGTQPRNVCFAPIPDQVRRSKSFFIRSPGRRARAAMPARRNRLFLQSWDCSLGTEVLGLQSWGCSLGAAVLGLMTSWYGRLHYRDLAQVCFGVGLLFITAPLFNVSILPGRPMTLLRAIIHNRLPARCAPSVVE
jgi:hypothetical protein